MSVRLKNCQSNIFKLIIVKAKLIKLLMPYYNIFSKLSKKNHFLNPKYQNFDSFIFVIDKNIKINKKNLFPFTSDLYL